MSFWIHVDLVIQLNFLFHITFEVENLILVRSILKRFKYQTAHDNLDHPALNLNISLSFSLGENGKPLSDEKVGPA